MHRICLLQYTESYNGIVPLFMHKSCVCHVPLTLHCRLQYMSAVRRRSNSIGLSDCCSDTGEWDVTQRLDNGSTCMNTHWTISPWIKAVSLKQSHTLYRTCFGHTRPHHAAVLRWRTDGDNSLMHKYSQVAGLNHSLNTYLLDDMYKSSNDSFSASNVCIMVTGRYPNL